MIDDPEQVPTRDTVDGVVDPVEAASDGAAETVEAATDAVDPIEAATDAPEAIEAADVAAEPETAIAGAVPAEPEPAEPEPAEGLASPESPPVEAPPAVETPPAPPSRVAVGQAIAEQLHAGGVRWAFTVPGESFLGLLDALPGAGIRVVATRHEGAAAFMAEAVGQLTGRPALCLGTRAVGAANLAIGIHTALADSTPMIAVAGQVGRHDRGREAFQEVDLVGTIGGYAKWAAEPASADEVPAAVGEALRRAVGDRPGPTFLSLAEDLLDELVDRADVAPSAGPPPTKPDPSAVGAVLRLLAGARRPVILAGAGVLRARCSTDLTRLAELLRVPIIASWRRGDVVSNAHPLYLGMAGLAAPATVRARLEEADAILALGTRLNEATTYGYAIPRPGQRWALVDLEPRPSRAGLPAPDLALAVDARSFVRAALERLKGACLDAETTDARAATNVEDRAAWEAATEPRPRTWSGPGVDPEAVVSVLRRVLPDDAILTTDAGNFAGWLARGYRFGRPGTFLGPTSGAMGYGLPAAIAAALVHRDRRVVAWTGDGGLAMTMAELETAVRERLKLTVFVLDNERYGTISMFQSRRSDGPHIATDLGPVDFAAIARALGANGVRVDRDADVEAALRTALVAERPTLIQLALDRRWVSVDEHP